ncbi:uncharacterized protein PGTG_14349 [Puccinia graminis f. sp. tritici CRL 75-36-700-3]|uniref:DUF1764 domain-containing protein n=2 Tax=Puccinia graminis f. sp. tritici TaxID=56615 RepID=E3KV42_PUCGT|nr:uncharacterized protein PGTG_14349 [Puccinia graminis f. sp. tritici CRL 75-36-700-3]EFP88265.2 hypothetical protein PGTG_14349 [Puccinia graminis f. sp. tritici CRL 75-36-700-3]
MNFWETHHRIFTHSCSRSFTMVSKNLSEIDAIFSSKGTNNSTTGKKAKARPPDHPGPSDGEGSKTGRSRASGASDGKALASGEERRLNNKKKIPSLHDRPALKRRAEEEPSVEVLLDPSQALLHPPPALDPNCLKKKKKKGNGLPSTLDLDDEQERAFRDSRGTRAKTEDGLMIYSVEELKIGLGQDTPECPFDCQCCF